MRSSVAVALIAVFLAIDVAYGSPAHACSCVEPDLAATAAEVSAVFAGEQVGRFEAVSGQGFSSVVLQVDVTRAFKGAVRPGDVVELSTGSDSAGCGIDFGGSGEVGIMAWDNGNGSLSVDLCSSPWPVEDLAAFFGDEITDATVPVDDTTDDSFADFNQDQDVPAVPDDEFVTDGTFPEGFVADPNDPSRPGAATGGSDTPWLLLVVLGLGGAALIVALTVPARSKRPVSVDED